MACKDFGRSVKLILDQFAMLISARSSLVPFGPEHKFSVSAVESIVLGFF